MVTIKENVNVEAQAIFAKKAARKLSLLTTEEKNDCLMILADTLETEYQFILKANESDLEEGHKKGYGSAFMDRLKLTKGRIFDFAEGIRNVARLEDPTGKTVSSWTLENCLEVEKVTVPLGVIGMIYEARPNVTIDATGLALKSGNSIILKGGSSALHSNKAIIDVIHAALELTKIPKDAVQFISSTDREATQQLFTMKEHVDVLIPRGGASLINAVVKDATVPVLETGVGTVISTLTKRQTLLKQ